MDNQDEKDARFEAGLQQLALDVYGVRLTGWVLPYLGLDEDMDLVEDIMVPETQTMQATAGLLRFAQVNSDHAMTRALHLD